MFFTLSSKKTHDHFNHFHANMSHTNSKMLLTCGLLLTTAPALYLNINASICAVILSDLINKNTSYPTRPLN